MIDKESIICPRCKHVHNEWWEFIDFEEDDQEFDMECINCDEEFHVNVEITREFDTEVVV